MDITFADHTFTLHHDGVLLWPKHKMAIVSDLHFEKGTAFTHKKMFLPPYDTRETLLKLKTFCDMDQIDAILFLGDVFHDERAYNRMMKSDRDMLNGFLNCKTTIWVEGNHERGFIIPGTEVHEEYMLDGIIFRHIANPDDEMPEISGHYHPCIRFKHKGQKIRRACYVNNHSKIIMPAFGAYTGGLDIFDPAIQSILSRDNTFDINAYLLGTKKVFCYPIKKSGIGD